MRVLVAGGAGYVGSHVVAELLASGHEPVVFDNLSTGHSESVRGAELIIGDLADQEALARTVQAYRFDGVIHLAACSLVGESVRSPGKYFRNNVSNGFTLFDQLVAAEIPWIVLSSTAAVYGDPEEVPIPESHPMRPTNPYGESKLMLERALAWYQNAYGLRSACLRYFNAAGAHPAGQIGEDHSPETHLIPILMQVALAKRPAIEIFGTDYATPDGTAVRDYVHVCDLATAHLAVMKHLHDGAPSASYNLGSQAGYSVLEIIETSRQVTGKEIPARKSSRREGDPPVLVALAEKARLELNWTPKYGLHDIIETAWNWHEKHPAGYGIG